MASLQDRILHLATLRGRLDVVRMLVENTVDTSRVSLDCVVEGRTALMKAISSHHSDVERFLKAAGAASLELTDHTPASTDTVTSGEPSAASRVGAASELVSSTRRQQSELHRRMLASLEPRQTDLLGVTTLMLVVERFDRRHRAEMIGRLLEAGAAVDARDIRARTALFVAADQGCVDSTRALLGRGASVNATDFEGTTPLAVAVRQLVACRQASTSQSRVAQFLEVIKELLRHNADRFHPNKSCSESALTLAQGVPELDFMCKAEDHKTSLVGCTVC